jgi:hypothetical protein
MAKWSGKIGYVITEETSKGIYDTNIVEKVHYGDLVKNYKRQYNSSDTPNDGIDISNNISIVATPFALRNFHTMQYCEFMGTKWKISSVEVQYPRLILTLGGIYNGNLN